MASSAGLIINSNTGAMSASAALRMTQGRLNSTMKSLQTGRKINGPGDDAGGLGVSMKEEAEISRTRAVNENVSNALAYIDTQDGILDKVYEQLNRISTLVAKYSDNTKSSTDKASYSTEFKEIVAEISSVITEKFNGVSLFASASGQNITVFTTQDAGKSVTIAKANLGGDSTITTITGATTLSATAVSGSTGITNITSAITTIASMRSSASAKSSRLFMVQDRLTVNETNLTSALSLIVDTDVARASTELSKQQILVQSGTAMLAQANQQPQSALRLIG